MSIHKIDPSENFFHKKLLRDNLYKIFGDFDETILDTIEKDLEWLELEGGDILLKEGDEGDSLYFVLSGRLEATVLDPTGAIKKIGEIIRGETVGEMSVYTGEPRFATVTALRNSVLVKLSKVLFNDILRSYPDVSLNVTKLVIERYKKNQFQVSKQVLVNICMINLNDTKDNIHPGYPIYELLQNKGKYLKLDEKSIINKFGPLTNEENSPEASRKIIHWLNDLESSHDKVFYFCDTKNDLWYTKCIKQADHLVVFADANQNHALSEFENKNLAKINAKVTFVLSHNENEQTPQNTRNWLDIRPWVSRIIHVRKNNKDDQYRLSRIVDEKAIGIVFAGGGAKGFAHLGVLKAMEERGIVFDYVGGTSVGAIIASGNAFGKPMDEVIKVSRKAAFFNPSKDVNILPILSVVKGKRLKTMVATAMQELSGKEKNDISDTWKTLFIVATNFSTAEEEVMIKGDLTTSIVASSSIPGVYPPVIIDGNLYVDGGTFNNFPADVMNRFGADKIIGVDFMVDKSRKIDLDEMPSNNQVLKDKLLFWKKNKYRVPGMTSTIVNSTILYSTSKRGYNKTFLDLHLNPNLNKYGITAWKKFDEIVKQGYLYANEYLDGLSDDFLDLFRNK